MNKAELKQIDNLRAYYDESLQYNGLENYLKHQINEADSKEQEALKEAYKNGEGIFWDDDILVINYVFKLDGDQTTRTEKLTRTISDIL